MGRKCNQKEYKVYINFISNEAPLGGMVFRSIRSHFSHVTLCIMQPMVMKELDEAI